MAEQEHPTRRTPLSAQGRPTAQTRHEPAAPDLPRDEFDIHLARTLAAQAGADARDCPDAETLAAWLDQTLDAASRARCELHLASCLRCQAILAAGERAMTAILPGMESGFEAAALPASPLEPAAGPGAALPDSPELEHRAQAPPASPPVRLVPRPRRWVAWAAPVGLAAAAVLAVWIGRTAWQSQAPTEGGPSEIAATPAPSGDEPSRAASAGPVEDTASNEANAAAPTAPAKAAAAPPPSQRLAQQPRRQEADEGQGRALSAEQTAARRQEAEPKREPAAARARGAAEPERAADTAASHVEEARGIEPSTAARPTVGQPPPPPAGAAPSVAATPAARPPVATTPAEAAPKAESTAYTLRSTSRPIRIGSPSGRVSWLLTPDGRILRTSAGEEPVEAATTAGGLRAGTAVSDQVAWAVGAAGAVWRTVDGRAWTKVASPIDAEFVAVEASSADHAIVTASDGVRFATDDGGRTWRVVAP